MPSNKTAARTANKSASRAANATHTPMNCPYCDRQINAFTGLQELLKFQRHLNKCRKRPKHIVLTPDGPRAEPFDMNAALELRAKSGQ